MTTSPPPDWTLLARKIEETWETTRGHQQRFERIDARLDRIEQQMLVVVKLAQAREGEQAVNRELVEGWAAVRRELLALERRLEALETKVG
jgi:hypothetical protein